jgi:protein-L-isoaspartate(D-aspartate) O-methyltransferase
MKFLKLIALAAALYAVAQAPVHAQSQPQPPAKPQAQAPAAQPQAQPVWDFAAYKKAMEAGGRKVNISEQTFKNIQARKTSAEKSVKNYLDGKFGKADPDLLKAFGEVPREYYMYNYEQDKSMAASSYEAKPTPWQIGYGSALSDYLGQVYMTQLCAPKKDYVVLEIGTGSGYQISLLSRMVKEAYSIEIIKPLGEKVSKIFTPLGYNNVHTKVGDGWYGWPEVQGGFDIIIVTCSARSVPPPLLQQLKPGGKMLIPIGQPYKRGQFLYVYTKDPDGKIHSRKDMGVFFIPMKGQALADEPKPTQKAEIRTEQKPEPKAEPKADPKTK